MEVLLILFTNIIEKLEDMSEESIGVIGVRNIFNTYKFNQMIEFESNMYK